jgi:hypothetical protein
MAKTFLLIPHGAGFTIERRLISDGIYKYLLKKFLELMRCVAYVACGIFIYSVQQRVNKEGKKEEFF